MTVTIDSKVTDLALQELIKYDIDVDIEPKELIATSTVLTAST